MGGGGVGILVGAVDVADATDDGFVIVLSLLNDGSVETRSACLLTFIQFSSFFFSRARML